MTPLRSLIEKILDELFETDAVYDMDSNAKRNLKIIYYTKFQQAITELIEEAQPEKKQRLDSPRSFGDGDIVDVSSGYNQAIDEYKSNLLKGVRG